MSVSLETVYKQNDTCSAGIGQPESHESYDHLKFSSRMSISKTPSCMCVLVCSVWFSVMLLGW